MQLPLDRPDINHQKQKLVKLSARRFKSFGLLWRVSWKTVLNILRHYHLPLHKNYSNNYEYGATERMIPGMRKQVLRQKSALLPLHPPYIPHRLNREWTQAIMGKCLSYDTV